MFDWAKEMDVEDRDRWLAEHRDEDIEVDVKTIVEADE